MAESPPELPTEEMIEAGLEVFSEPNRHRDAQRYIEAIYLAMKAREPAVSGDEVWRNRCEHLLACLDSCEEAGGIPSELDPEDVAEIDATRAALTTSKGAGG